MAKLGVITIELALPGTGSLKGKRSQLKPLLFRLRKEFNVSAAEVGAQDTWQSAFIACAMVANRRTHLEKQLPKIPNWIEKYWPMVDLVDWEIEII